MCSRFILAKVDVDPLRPASREGRFHLGRLTTVPVGELRDTCFRYCITEVNGSTVILREVDSTEIRPGALLQEALHSAHAGAMTSAARGSLVDSGPGIPPEVVPQAALRHGDQTGHRLCLWGHDRHDVEFLLDVPLPIEFHTHSWRCATCKRSPEERVEGKAFRFRRRMSRSTSETFWCIVHRSRRPYT